MEIWLIIGALVVVVFLYYRYFVTHARREVFRWTQSRWAGRPYDVKPMRNNGWYYIAMIIGVVVLVLMLAN